MSKVNFEVAELEILAIYQCDKKQETLDYIREAMAFVDAGEKEILALMESAADKLSQISDGEYAQLELDSYLYEQEDAVYED